MEGVEPSSKHGTNMLSTCLSEPSVFVSKQDPSHQLEPYPLKISHLARGTLDAIPDIPTPPCSVSLRKMARGEVLSQQPCAEIKLIY